MYNIHRGLSATLTNERLLKLHVALQRAARDPSPPVTHNQRHRAALKVEHDAWLKTPGVEAARHAITRTLELGEPLTRATLAKDHGRAAAEAALMIEAAAAELEVSHYSRAGAAFYRMRFPPEPKRPRGRLPGPEPLAIAALGVGESHTTPFPTNKLILTGSWIRRHYPHREFKVSRSMTGLKTITRVK